MYPTTIQNAPARPAKLSVWLFLLFLFKAGVLHGAAVATMDGRYPGLATGMLRSAGLERMNDDILLMADGFSIRRSELTDIVKDQAPKLRQQMEKNLLFVLEQLAARRILLNEAQKAGIKSGTNDENEAIQTLLEQKTATINLSEAEIRNFYEANREMVGEADFEQVRDNIRRYLLQDKKQQAVSDYIDALSRSAHLRVNEKWIEAQSRLAADNPVDKARSSGKPTMVEFGATGCVPCDMMQPILENLRKKYPEKLNVVFIHVGEEQVLAARYGIRSIPVQVFFDSAGKEVFRHVGFFAETEVIRRLSQMGVKE